jgi:hypothetical protein
MFVIMTSFKYCDAALGICHVAAVKTNMPYATPFQGLWEYNPLSMQSAYITGQD